MPLRGEFSTQISVPADWWFILSKLYTMSHPKIIDGTYCTINAKLTSGLFYKKHELPLEL